LSFSSTLKKRVDYEVCKLWWTNCSKPAGNSSRNVSTPARQAAEDIHAILSETEPVQKNRSQLTTSNRRDDTAIF